MRATQTTTFRSLQNFLDKTSERMSTLRIQAATGKRINRASDDPTAISPMLSSKTQILSADRYILTMATGLDKVQNTDGYLGNAEDLMQRVKEIAIAGVNGALSPADLETYADEIALLKDQVIATANGQVDGKYLFAGYEIKTTPFVENPAYDPATYDPTIYRPTAVAGPPPLAANEPPVLYQGDAGMLNLEVGPNEQLEVAVDGGRLFLGLDETNSVVGFDVFHQLSILEEALRGNDPAVRASAINSQLDDLDATTDQFRKYRSVLGITGRRLEQSMGRMEEAKVEQKAILSRYEDVDIVAAITSLQQQEASFEAALSVTSKVSDLTILRYL